MRCKTILFWNHIDISVVCSALLVSWYWALRFVQLLMNWSLVEDYPDWWLVSSWALSGEVNYCKPAVAICVLVHDFFVLNINIKSTEHVILAASSR